MNGPSMIPASAFFASRKGVCVYVTVQRLDVRVCFSAPGAPGVAESDAPPSAVAQAVERATEAFRAHRDALLPLFETIANSSQVPD